MTTHIVLTPSGQNPTVQTVGAPPAYRVVRDFDWIGKAFLVVFLVVVALVGGKYLVDAIRDHANYADCQHIGLCKASAIAHISKETGANIGSDGSVTFPAQTVPTATHQPPIIVQQPPQAPVIVQQPAAPPPVVVPAPAPRTSCVHPCAAPAVVAGGPTHAPGERKIVNGAVYHYGQNNAGQWGWCRDGGNAC